MLRAKATLDEISRGYAVAQLCISIARRILMLHTRAQSFRNGLLGVEVEAQHLLGVCVTGEAGS